MEPLSALMMFAPQLVKWATGNDKAEEVTKIAVDVAQKITGNETTEGAINALGANPDLIIQYQQTLAGLQADLEKAYLSDVSNARAREIAIATSEFSPLLNKIIVPVLALIVVIGGGAMLYWSPNADVRTAASNLVMLVLGYFFGTSLGSKRANEVIHDFATKKQD
jgi:hypothetical protein